MLNFKEVCDSLFSHNEGRLHEQRYLVPNNAQQKIQQLWFITKNHEEKREYVIKI